ncbi:single-stranded DNA endonuclease [Mesorhizobium loti]|uniref:Single-stranded DNA endonuclease n=1 Tax=Rhizobium loti TaxID=381 RepID=A0A101KTX3_RHILI|nr:single-stranded DNA endonuclease [Mesorhizobium loti]
MILITADLRARLIANGAAEVETDHVPVVKLFNPTGAATWLLSELDADGDTLFGLCDLGFGFPELGSVSLAELQAVEGPIGIGIERDLAFAPRFPLSVYAEAARLAGHITEAERLLRQAAAAALSISLPELPPDRAE